MGVLIIASVYTPAALQAPAIVTSDTGAYCRQLVARIDDLMRAKAPIPPVAAKLAEEGRQRCLIGQVRQGILHLRQAVMMIQPSLPEH